MTPEELMKSVGLTPEDVLKPESDTVKVVRLFLDRQAERDEQLMNAGSAVLSAFLPAALEAWKAHQKAPEPLAPEPDVFPGDPEDPLWTDPEDPKEEVLGIPNLNDPTVAGVLASGVYVLIGRDYVQGGFLAANPSGTVRYATRAEVLEFVEHYLETLK